MTDSIGPSAKVSVLSVSVAMEGHVCVHLKTTTTDVDEEG